MKYFARVTDGLVAEVLPEFVTVDGIDVPIDERYHPAIIAMLIECPEGTLANVSTYDQETGIFTTPEPEGLAEADTGNGNPPPN